MPFGWYGVWAALPFGMWLFLAVEGVPLAAEEAKDPARDMPKGIIAAMLFCCSPRCWSWCCWPVPRALK
ncbi:hypothetical protein HSBAA_08530 [Vreelandella sulfidaeris]|uniref:Amino acid permease/ SLC12A domain-containing protein n=1 Tax=Vreelandella sulfidaeris TaxID=115553 RepID=A0A455U1P0_9GAMM|nr:hypothetical protein HSBAA_08530 [Halomonas sulfidaeris]